MRTLHDASLREAMGANARRGVLPFSPAAMTLQLVLNSIDFGLGPDESVMAPRFMTDHFISSFGQKPPALGQLRINPELGPTTLDALKDHLSR